MKHFIWMLCGIFLSGLLLGTLSACGADSHVTAFVTTGQPSGGEAESAPEEPAQRAASAPEAPGGAPEKDAPAPDGGAESLDVPFQDLNETNIAALEYPKPDVANPEPAG